MKFFLISDNTDTQMGLRLAGIEGVIAHSEEAVILEVDKAIANQEIAIILMTTKTIELCPEYIYDKKLHLQRPLIVEIPDRHDSAKIGETIDRYISEAIGIKI